MGFAGVFMSAWAEKSRVILYDVPIMSLRISTPKLWLRQLFGVVWLVVASAPLMATQKVLVGEISIRSSDEPVNAQAMRAAIVRATGDRRAADDPIYQPLFADADRYVQIRRPATATSPSRITLDSAAIERAIDKLGRPRWVSERPVVLGVILSAPRGADRCH